MANEKDKAKKVGRPKKKDSDVINEEKEKVSMSNSHSQSEAQTQKPKEIIVHNAVGSVKELPDMPDTVTVANLQNRWKNVFGQYGNILSFDQITTAWNHSINVGNNPFTQNRRIKQIITPAKKYTKDEVAEIVANPENNEQALRAINWYIYYTEYVFQNIVKLNRDVPNFNYWYSPLYIEAGSGNSDSIKKESIFVDKILKSFSPKLTFKTVATQCAVEGKCTYLCRLSYEPNKKNVNYMVLQKLNADQVKIVGLGSKNRYIVAFDFSIFLQPGYYPEQYPQFIQDIWNDMITNGMILVDKKGKKRINPRASLPPGYMLETRSDGSWMFWATLPQDAAVTFYTDGAHNNAFGDMIGLLDSFSNLEDYAYIQGQLASKGVNSVMTFRIPMVKDPKPGADSTSISVDTALGYQNLWDSMVSGNIMAFISPFEDAELHTLTSEPDSMNIVSERISQLIASSGQTGLITLSDKPNIISVKTSQKIQAARNDYLTRQFEDWLNYIINDAFDLKNTWQVKLFGDIFTDEETKVQVKEMFLNGATGLLPKLLAYEGLTMEDYKGAQDYIDALGITIKSNAQELAEKTEKDNTQLAKATANQKTVSTPGSKSNVGRPSIPDGKVESDSTGNSKNEGNNISDTK